MFIDYNQNARDRTVASAYSVRPTPDARVSTPLSWDEVPDVEAAELRIDTVPAAESPSRAIRARTSTPSRFAGRAAGARPARRGERAARRAVATELPQDAGEAPRVAPSRRARRRAKTASGSARHSLGGLSSRQRRIFVPWRMRPPLAWSKVTSTTSSGRSEIHSSSFSFFQRLGSPCPRWPVSYGASVSTSARFSAARRPEECPTMWSSPVLVVEAQDQRADRPLLLAGAVAGDHGVDRAHPLDLDHPLALAGPVGRAGVLGHHSLAVGQPRLGLSRGRASGGERDAVPPQLFERGAALGERAAPAVTRPPRPAGRRRCSGPGSARPASRSGRRPDGSAAGARRSPGWPSVVVDHDLAVQHVAPGREGQLREVAAERLAAPGLDHDLLSVHEHDRPEAVELWLVRPLLARGQLLVGAASWGSIGGLSGSATARS